MPNETPPGLPGEVDFRIEVPDELQTGQFADFLGVWSGPHAFTLDFAVTGQPEAAEDGGNVTVPVRVVSRIKIPHTLAPSILQALASNVTKFETAVGPIRRPGEDNDPVYPPEDL
jgi:hypothetical protein